VTPTVVFVVLLALFPAGAWAEARLFSHQNKKAARHEQ